MESAREMWETFVALLEARPLLWAGTVLLSSLLAAAVLNWLFGRVLARWTRKTKTDIDDRLVALLRRPLYLTAILVGLWVVARRLPLPHLAETAVRGTLQTIGLVTWMLFATRASVLLVDALVDLEKRTTLIQPRSLPLFEKAAQLMVVGAFAYLLLQVWGIDVGAWLVSAGVIGIAVGFAAKDTLANLFSGIFILADSPYRVGDWIKLDSGERGQVKHIGLRSTRLLTRDDIEITMPNAVIANAKITNESGGPWDKERVRIPIGVAYGSDVDKVRAILAEIADSDEHIQDDPEPRVRFRRFGDSALEFELLGWIAEPILRGRAVDALNMAIYKRFAEEGVEIPYPKRDVYLHRVDDG